MSSVYELTVRKTRQLLGLRKIFCVLTVVVFIGKSLSNYASRMGAFYSGKIHLSKFDLKRKRMRLISMSDMKKSSGYNVK